MAERNSGLAEDRRIDLRIRPMGVMVDLYFASYLTHAVIEVARALTLAHRAPCHCLDDRRRRRCGPKLNQRLAGIHVCYTSAAIVAAPINLSRHRHFTHEIMQRLDRGLKRRRL